MGITDKTFLAAELKYGTPSGEKWPFHEIVGLHSIHRSGKK
jgi:hypothetical protein